MLHEYSRTQLVILAHIRATITEIKKFFYGIVFYWHTLQKPTAIFGFTDTRVQPQPKCGSNIEWSWTHPTWAPLKNIVYVSASGRAVVRVIGMSTKHETQEKYNASFWCVCRYDDGRQSAIRTMSSERSPIGNTGSISIIMHRCSLET